MEAITGKASVERKKVIHKTLEMAVSSDVKVVEGAGATQLIRQLFSSSVKEIGWRQIRSYLVADKCTLIDVTTPGASVVDGNSTHAHTTQRLQVGGFLRGKPLPVNSLVHVPGMGTGRIASIQCNPALQPGGGSRGARGAEPLTLLADPAL
jgi:hypothetical protein